MGGTTFKGLQQVRQNIERILIGPPALAFIPALSLITFRFGGEAALLVISVALPISYLLGRSLSDGRSGRLGKVNYLGHRDFEKAVDRYYQEGRNNALQSALFQIDLEEADAFIQKYGQATAEDAICLIRDRIAASLRDGDVISQLSPTRFAVCLAPVRHLDLEICIQLASRLQTAIEEPLSVDRTTAYLSASIGFCQHMRAPSANGKSWLEASDIALQAAQKRGPSTIRAFSEHMRIEARHKSELHNEIEAALERGQIRPWFQPQISTETGQITGFEALARWQHPDRGMIVPPSFLPIIKDAGLLERLAEVVTFHAFSALNAWDKAGVKVPQVGVNFDGTELANPKLLEKIKWELDRFNLTPDRLAVEVLETVVAGSPDDMITRNIRALRKLGCRIDLDDFGTGHASIASIRRFAVSRIKIDRSFVMRADRDPEQQRMIGAILTMAERLQIETLAEGVESVGEHVLLAQLGCHHVQGFGIGRPMPFEQTLVWIARHNAKLADMPQISIIRGKQQP